MTNPTPHGQVPQQPCPTCAALARTVMLDQVSFDRKPDCYGIRQITDDEGVEEWEDIRTSPDVAREEAYDMMATGRGEIYEVVPLWTTPQPSPTAQAAESVPAPQQPAQDDALIRQLVEALEGYRRNHNDTQPCDAERAGRARLEGTVGAQGGDYGSDFDHCPPLKAS